MEIDLSLKKAEKATLSVPVENGENGTTFSQGTLTEQETAALKRYKSWMPEGTTDEEALLHAQGDEVPEGALPWWKELIVQVIFFCIAMIYIFIPVLLIVGLELRGYSAGVLVAFWVAALLMWNRKVTGVWLWKQ
ncbi:MAG: hypothetical protein ACRBBW_20875 [Cellvibrionaceae bacterium]